MERQLQFSYLNSFDCQITAVKQNTGTIVSQNLVKIYIRALIFLLHVNLLTH